MKTHVTLNQETKRKNLESISTAAIMKRGNNKQCFLTINQYNCISLLSAI